MGKTILGMPERFWRHAVIADHGYETPCLEWAGFKLPNGYGRWRYGGQVLSAHRSAYEAARGPILDGLQVDHLCRNRACVNAAHLEAVTPRENAIRGQAPNILLMHANVCHAGHEFTEENTYVRPSGTRMCKACHRQRRREARKRQTAERRAAARSVPGWRAG